MGLTVNEINANLRNPELNKCGNLPIPFKKGKRKYCNSINICLEKCEHKTIRSQCKEFVGTYICEHNTNEYYCKICTPMACDFCSQPLCSMGHFSTVHKYCRS
jgi:hypothetical protein